MVLVASLKLALVFDVQSGREFDRCNEMKLAGLLVGDLQGFFVESVWSIDGMRCNGLAPVRRQGYISDL